MIPLSLEKEGRFILLCSLTASQQKVMTCLFDEKDTVQGFKVNRAFEERFEKEKRRKELQKLTQKFGEDESEESEPSDDDAELITPESEAKIGEVLLSIKKGEPMQGRVFFSNSDFVPQISDKGKKFTLGDEFRRSIVKTTEKVSLPGGESKQDFLKVANEEGTLEMAKKVEDHQQIVENKVPIALKEALAVDDTDNSETKFLKEFFLYEKWRNSTSKEDTWEERAADEQDEEFFDRAEQWEKDFEKRQFRHEEEGASEIQSFARQQEGLLRAKDPTRKEARQRKEERKAKQQQQEEEELKRLKTLKRKEIEEQQQLIAKIAGVQKNKIAWTREELQKDFDPESFDKNMAQMFGDNFYAEEDDADVELNEGGTDDDDIALLYPTTIIDNVAGKGAKLEVPDIRQLEEELEKKTDEYWRLHYHKIAGGVRTRFKYRPVNVEKFGMTDEDILSRDDRTLNMIAPMNCYASYLSEVDNKRDRFRAIHRKNNMREINPERVSRKYKTPTVVLDPADEQGKEKSQAIAEAAKRIDNALSSRKRKR